MRVQLLSLIHACISAVLVGRIAASCYYPDGSFPDDYVYVSCGSEDNTSSACCILSEGDQCLSNGLCYYPFGEYMFRGGCTDKTWNSTNCFQHCKGGETDGSYDKLVSCGDDRYCCYSDGSTCCNDDSKVFTVDSATVIKDLASTASYTLPIETPTDAVSTSISSANTGTTAAPSAKATYTESQQTKPTDSQVTNSDAAATASSTSTSLSNPEAQSNGPSKTALIGAAVGGVVVLIVAVGLVWFFVRRRYRKKLAAGSSPQSFPLSSDGFQKLPDKSPRPVEVAAPLHSPAPPYQPSAYQVPVPHHEAVEMDNSYLVPSTNQWGQPVFEAPAQPYRQM